MSERKHNSPSHVPAVLRIEGLEKYADMHQQTRPEPVKAAIRVYGLVEKLENLSKYLDKWENDTDSGDVQATRDAVAASLERLSAASDRMVGLAKSQPDFDTGWEKTTGQSAPKFEVGDMCAISEKRRDNVAAMLQQFGHDEQSAKAAAAGLLQVCMVQGRSVAVMLPLPGGAGEFPFTADSTQFEPASK